MLFYDRKVIDDIAENLLLALKEKRLLKIGIEEVRSAVAGFNSCLMQFDNKSMTRRQMEDMEGNIIRKIVMKAGEMK